MHDFLLAVQMACTFTGCTDCARCEKTQEWYSAQFEKEYKDAQDEFTRLSELFRDVCWYNFETECRKWQHPYPWRHVEPS